LELAFSANLFAGIERISEKEIDLSKPFRVYMTSGRSTILEFPCEIGHTVLGLEEEIKLITGPDNKYTVVLWLMNPSVQPTNLTVKCGNEYYIFDIIPNNHTHQDFINIVDAFDSRSKDDLTLINSSSSLSSSKDALDEVDSEFEIKESDLLETRNSHEHEISEDEILNTLNLKSTPKSLVRTISNEDFMRELKMKGGSDDKKKKD
jgi:hypothetical protein